MKETHDDIHPLIKDVLENLGRFTWPEYKERNSYEGSASAAQKLWSRYAKSHNLPIELPREDAPKRTKYPPPIDFTNLELRKVVTDGDDTPRTKYFGQKPNYFKEITADTPDIEIIGGTHHVGGNQQWIRWKEKKDDTSGISEERLAAFENRLEELEKSKTGRSITFDPPKTGSFENWLIIGCAHVPAHNKWLWDSTLRYIEHNEVNGIILAGDFLDLKSLSSHDAGKVQSTNLFDEYIEGRKAIIDLEGVLLPDAKKIHLYGNHEDRYLRTLERIENNRFGAALLSPMEGMKMEGWQILNNWKEDYVLLGDSLEVAHGFYTNKNAAKTHLEAAAKNNRSIIFYHTHREEFASNGKNAAWNCGSLADFKNPAFGYVPRHVRDGWRNGLCHVTIDCNGEHYVTPIRCSEKNFFVNGKQY